MESRREKETSRWTDNPFVHVRDGRVIWPPMTPEEEARHFETMDAWRDYNDTGDTAGLVRLGIFPPDDAPEA